MSQPSFKDRPNGTTPNTSPLKSVKMMSLLPEDITFGKLRRARQQPQSQGADQIGLSVQCFEALKRHRAVSPG